MIHIAEQFGSLLMYFFFCVLVLWAMVAFVISITRIRSFPALSKAHFGTRNYQTSSK